MVLGLALASALAQAPLGAPGNFNPLVPGYFADPTIKKFGELYYLYATTDGNGGGRGPATVWVSRDFVNWVLVPMNWPTTPFYWAPDVVQRPDGRFYLYYNQPCNTYGAVSDTPIGPWTPMTPGDGLIIPDRLVKDVITLDTQLFEDTDGTLYGYWGTWGIFPNSGCGWGVFNEDMKTFARLGMIPNTQARDFFEAPVMIKRNGVYYLTYSSGSCHDASYRVQYAVGTRPDGEFRMGPNNPILATSTDGKVHGPGHHSFLQEGEEYYIIYHRHDIPVTPNGMHRQVCADRLVFDGDGVIRKVTPTHEGIGYLALRNRTPNLAFGKPVTASSHYADTLRRHDYKADYAVDDNNATLWRPGDNGLGHWLQVDLGRAERVGRIETQFEYGTWYYQYLIETSVDGEVWKIYADRRSNRRWGSPMVDEGETEARFVRLTVTGTEYPGLFGAIWNLRVFPDATKDSLLTVADEAFAQFVAPKQTADAAASPGQARSSGLPRQAAPVWELESAGLQLGTPVTRWTNSGSLGGQFVVVEGKPLVSMANGRKAVRFSGKEWLRWSQPAPRSLAGNSSFTVTAWVNNPQIGESECFLSWAGRGGPDATTAQFGYGTHPEFGAAGHWGFADMGFGGHLPKAGQWHHFAIVFDGVIERVYVNGAVVHSEAKMLLMHEGRPVLVGASEPGTELFDGYLGSLRVYDGALSAAAVKELAVDSPAAEVLVHLDSVKLNDGPLASWENNGALGGMFTAETQPPRVEAVQGRLAVRFGRGDSLRFDAESELNGSGFTVIGTVAASGNSHVLEAQAADGSWLPLLVVPAHEAWQEYAAVFRGGIIEIYAGGTAVSRGPMQAPGPIHGLRVGGGEPGFAGAISRLQLFRRPLEATELVQLHAVWKNEWRSPAPNPAAFHQKPAALNPNLVAMTATTGRSEFGPLEYRFYETTGQPGATNSGWIATPYFLPDRLQSNTRYAYRISMRDALGNLAEASDACEVITSPEQFQVWSDDFGSPRDFLEKGVAGTIWEGCLGASDQSAPESIAARHGRLRLQSKGTVWDGGKPLGAFLYRIVSGDFVAEAEVADYTGLQTRKVPGNNDGGLMARVTKEGDAGPGEDLVQLNFFPIWNQGNMVTSLDGGRSQKGNNLAWDAHRHLQLIRHGNLFHFRTSTDGTTWAEMPGSPVAREDMAGLPVQVGVYHASYGAEASYIEFRSFQLTVRR